MNWEQKFAAIKSLDADASLRMRAPGNWYVSARIEMKKNGVLMGEYGNGTTPEEAVMDHWRKYEGGVILVINAMKDSRRSIKWNGFMWEDVEEAKA